MTEIQFLRLFIGADMYVSRKGCPADGLSTERSAVEVAAGVLLAFQNFGDPNIHSRPATGQSWLVDRGSCKRWGSGTHHAKNFRMLSWSSACIVRTCR
jgi:hypothetical protein